jgi:hypothetical protein
MKGARKRAPEERRDGREEKLTMLMRATVEARTRLARARERLRAIDTKLRGAARDDYERQHNQALAEYVEAVGKARQARTRLLQQLKERAA